MIGHETVDAAKKWCDIGSNWINNGAVKLGLNYIDRAIAVFSENVEVNWMTYARHCKLDGLRRTGWEEEAEAMSEEVMRGYLEMKDAYGQALLLTHLAECMASQGRKERALVNLNLATAISEAHGLNTLLAYVLAERARVSIERENLIDVIRMFRRAEVLLEREGLEMEALHLRYSAAEAMVRLGERADAVAFLEDLQTKLMRGHKFREALEPLNLLGQLYEESGSWDERERITELVHLCGQSIVQEDGTRREPALGQPTVRLVEPSTSVAKNEGGEDGEEAETVGDTGEA